MNNDEINERYICDVLAEMRKFIEVYNLSAFKSLIEEAQIYADRMENKLRIYKDQSWREEQIKTLLSETKKIKSEKVSLENKIHHLKQELEELKEKKKNLTSSKKPEKKKKKIKTISARRFLV